MFLSLIKHAAQVDNAFAVELQREDGGAPGRRQAENERAVFVPAEMLIPSVLAWMEERNHFARAWVARSDFGVLVTVATLAGQREVFGDGRAAQFHGMNMFDMKITGRIAHLAAAVFTTTTHALEHQAAQFGADVRSTHKQACRDRVAA